MGEAQQRDELAQALESLRAHLSWWRDTGLSGLQRGAPRLDPLEAVAHELGDCQRCPLAQTRQHMVFGAGHPRARLVLVGEAPGAEEDRQGIPFVGKAGQLLTRMLAAIGLARDEVYICNVLKCRPPRNRDPRPDEIASCEPFLRKQLAAIEPELVVAMGAHAAQTLLRRTEGISRLRGRMHTYEGIDLIATFHPAYLLRSPERKAMAWEDLKRIRARLEQGGTR